MMVDRSEAKTGLQVTLNTLVITTDEIIPLPMLRAQQLLEKAGALGENEERTAQDNEALEDLLKDTRTQLEIAELSGYGTEESFKPLYEQLDEIEEKTAGGQGGKGWFDKIKQQVSDLF